MKEYDAATLHKLQKLELEILKDVDKMCKELDIKYFAIAGTALGAKRHGGFIPWDDDMDIGMMRADMNKLLEHIKEHCGNKYIIINNDEYNDFPSMTTQLTLRSTSFVIEEFKEMNIPFGIFLDIFPFDNIPDNNLLRFFYGIRMRGLLITLFLRRASKPAIAINGENIIGWKIKLFHAITSLIHNLAISFPISNRGIFLKMFKLATKFNGEKTNRIGFLTFRFDTLTIEYKDVFPVHYCKFEDMEIMVPNALDKHLKKMYGNYKELPPVEKRKNHFPFKLDFGEYDDKD